LHHIRLPHTAKGHIGNAHGMVDVQWERMLKGLAANYLEPLLSAACNVHNSARIAVIPTSIGGAPGGKEV